MQPIRLRLILAAALAAAAPAMAQETAAPEVEAPAAESPAPETPEIALITIGAPLHHPALTAGKDANKLAVV